MGIRQTYVRITPDELTFLHQCQSDKEVWDFLAQPHHKPFFFWPLDEAESLASYRQLCIEKSWWETLQGVVALQMHNDPTPIWDTVEDGTPIRDFWIGYGPLRFLTPDEVQRFLGTLQAIPDASLHQRFLHDWANIEMEPDEKEQYFLGFLDCYQTLVKFVHEAFDNGEVLVWRIS
ncbi:MAG: YfbM family protein [Chloroflexota bacterium]|nr:YfbM family protein [Chloroflexota bacterium]